jgi:hypothetical protein
MRSRTILEGLSTGPRGIRWVADITHMLTVQVIVQFLSIWDLVRAVWLSLVPDRFVWKWSPNGIYSSSSAYVALFLGRVDILGARQIWKTKMPGKCKFFAWLVLHGRCWTFDRLHHHGLKDSDSFLVHFVHKRSKLWITCLSTVSSVTRRGSELSDIFFYPNSPQIVPCLSLLGGAPPGSRSLKPGIKVSMPSSSWSLGRFGRSAIGASMIGRP